MTLRRSCHLQRSIPAGVLFWLFLRGGSISAILRRSTRSVLSLYTGPEVAVFRKIQNNRALYLYSPQPFLFRLLPARFLFHEGEHNPGLPVSSPGILAGQVDIMPCHIHGGVAHDPLQAESIHSMPEHEQGGGMAQGVGCYIEPAPSPVGFHPPRPGSYIPGLSRLGAEYRRFPPVPGANLEDSLYHFQGGAG